MIIVYYSNVFCDIFHSQCTAVLVDTAEMTSRCCYLINDPVTVATANNTLYIRYDVKTSHAQSMDGNTAKGTVTTTASDRK